MPTYVQALTAVHVLISLVAIVAGFVAASRQLVARPSNTWTLLFLWTTIATTLTGFLFPFKAITPAFAFGILSTLVLAVALYARYAGGPRRPWNWVYAATATFAFYLNFFVLIAQAFLKVGFLHALAPNGNEPAFAIAQGVALLGFLALGVAIVRQTLKGDAPSPAVVPTGAG